MVEEGLIDSQRVLNYCYIYLKESRESISYSECLVRALREP
jgi:hypothetical protein